MKSFTLCNHKATFNNFGTPFWYMLSRVSSWLVTNRYTYSPCFSLQTLESELNKRAKLSHFFPIKWILTSQLSTYHISAYELIRNNEVVHMALSTLLPLVAFLFSTYFIIIFFQLFFTTTVLPRPELRVASI